MGYKVANFQNFNGWEGSIREHVSYFIDLMGPFSYYAEFYFREFSKSLTDRAYTWYLNLKPRSIQDWELLGDSIDAKSFCEEAKFTLVELGRTLQFPGEDLISTSEDFIRRPLVVAMQLMKKHYRYLST